MVTSYEVVWQRDTSGECSDEDEGSHTTADDSTTYVIRGLWGNSRYSITVRAINGAGSSEVSSMVTAMTLEGGKRDAIVPPATPIFHGLCIHTTHVHCSLQLLLLLPPLSVLLVHPLPSLSSGEKWSVVITMER